MIKNRFSRIGLLAIALLIFGCGQQEEQESKVKEAVEQAVTKEFKIYERAKQSLEKIEKESQERREQEKKLR